MVAPSRDLQLHGKHTFSSRRLGFSEIVSVKLFHTFPFFVSCGGFLIPSRCDPKSKSLSRLSERFRASKALNMIRPGKKPKRPKSGDLREATPLKSVDPGWSMDLSMDLSMVSGSPWYTWENIKIIKMSNNVRWFQRCSPQICWGQGKPTAPKEAAEGALLEDHHRRSTVSFFFEE